MYPRSIGRINCRSVISASLQVIYEALATPATGHDHTPFTFVSVSSASNSRCCLLIRAATFGTTIDGAASPPHPAFMVPPPLSKTTTRDISRSTRVRSPLTVAVLGCRGGIGCGTSQTLQTFRNGVNSQTSSAQSPLYASKRPLAACAAMRNAEYYYCSSFSRAEI
jgi:hypothetical protein